MSWMLHSQPVEATSEFRPKIRPSTFFYLQFAINIKKKWSKLKYSSLAFE